MMVKVKFLLLFCLLSCSCFAQDYPDSPSNYITDQANVLTEQQEKELNAKLKAFEDSTTNQIFVYIAQSLNGEVMSELCQEIFHKWKIGKEEKDNGILIAVFIDDHKFRIHTGYGLEGALPDILTKRIQDTEMKPHFKKNDYYTGLSNGVDKLIYYSAHEFTPQAVDEKSDKSWIGWAIGFGPNFILLLIMFYLVAVYKKKYKRWPEGKAKKKEVRGTNIRLTVALLLVFIPCLGAVVIFFLMSSFMMSPGKKSKSAKGIKRSEPNSTWWWFSSSGDSSSGSSSDSDSGSDFSGGGGGDSGGGGSDSDW